MKCRNLSRKKESQGFSRKLGKYDEEWWKCRFQKHKQVRPPFGLPPYEEVELAYIPEMADAPTAAERPFVVVSSPVIGETQYGGDRVEPDFTLQCSRTDPAATSQEVEALDNSQRVAVDSFDTREIARTASPIALTGGGLISAVIIAAGGATWIAVGAGVIAFLALAAAIEGSLRRTMS